MKEISKRTVLLKREMWTRDVSIINLASMLGLSRYTISRRLKNDDWKLSELEIIAKSMGLKPDYFFRPRVDKMPQ